MGHTSLNKLIGKPALSHHIPGDKWPIRDQFVGIEIELENVSHLQQRLHADNNSPYWEADEDGSLRNGVEYILREPLMGSQLSKAISYFYGTFTDFTDGPRTSIHVHLNMRQDEDSFEGLKNLLVLYYMYEDAFFKIADTNRKWCAYCNPFEDNPPEILTDVLRLEPESAPKALNMKLYTAALHNTNRYYGLNITALHRFGTLEFRHFPLVREEKKLVDWIMLLMELKAAARRLSNEGLSVQQLVQTREDVDKLQHYFPLFWNTLSTHVDSQQAFVRMVNVLGLTILTARATGQDMGENKAWGAYVAEQVKRGKVVNKDGVRRAVRPPPNPDEDILVEVFEENNRVQFGNLEDAGFRPTWLTPQAATEARRQRRRPVPAVTAQLQETLTRFITETDTTGL